MNNLDLMDNSNNDYQLIDELSKLVRCYYVNNKPVDRKFIEGVVSICMRNDSVELNDKSVCFTDEYCDGCYFENIIYFNYSKRIEYNLLFKDSLVGDSNVFGYYHALVTLLHEFAHVKQEFYDNMYNSNIVDIYKFCNDINESNYDFYSIYYDIFPIERYADIRGTYIAYLVMDRLGFNNMFYKREFIDSLIRDYFPDNVCPIERFACACDAFEYYEFRGFIPDYDISSDNLWDRLNFGALITDDEYDYLFGIYNDMMNRDYVCDDSVKRLILSYNRQF